MEQTIYKYYGSGETIKDMNIDKGNCFFNQDTREEECWGKTLCREGLEILQVEGIDFSGKERIYKVKIMTTNKGKLEVSKKGMTEDELRSCIKIDKK
jgi:hypothetical protein